MSCRSTSLSSAATSYAKQCSRYFSDSQVQSLYHQVKGSLDIDDSQSVSPEEYRDSIDALTLRVRHDETLSEHRRASLLSRLEDARNGDQVNMRTWQAVQELPERVHTAEAQYQHVLDVAAASLGSSSEEVHAMVQEARGGSWLGGGSFDDYADYPDDFRFDTYPGLPRDEATQRALRKLGYETFLAQPYPVFVYGTLRQGQGNNRVVAGGALAYAPAQLSGVGIYGASRGFPYAAEHPDPDAITKGEVIWISDDDAGRDARQGMDWLEGFHSDSPTRSHYERRRVTARLDNGRTEQVWVYLARGSARTQLHESDRITHGDWVRAKDEYRDPSYIRSRLLGL